MLRHNSIKILCSALIGCFSASSFAHTTSIGYVNNGSGNITFWFGTYHTDTTFTEGSIQLQGINGTSYGPTVNPFTLLTQTSPAGLTPGVNYFASDGTTLVPYGQGSTQYSPSATWQGASAAGLAPGRYRFTYIPIATPSADWDPWDEIIRSAEINLSNAFFGLPPSTPDTQSALQNTATVLEGTYSIQNAALINSFSYDCTLFDVKNLCITAGGRSTNAYASTDTNHTSALLIVAYQAIPSLRIGAYVDQNLVNTSNNGADLSNGTPMVGLFGVWNARRNGTGTEVKISAAYGQKSALITREVIGSSEPGSGASDLKSQGAQITVKYGFETTQDVIISPYFGIRYTQNNKDGYTEARSATVLEPLTYSPLSINATTALIGVDAQYRVAPKAKLFATAGIESDTNNHNDQLTATGSTATGVIHANFNPNPVRTRPSITVGASIDVHKNQRLGVTGNYRQEPYKGVSSTTFMATYTVGL